MRGAAQPVRGRSELCPQVARDGDGDGVVGSSVVSPVRAGLPCEARHSLCGGRNELCIGRGPAYGADDHGFESNVIIASRQAAKAAELWSGDGTPLQGALGSVVCGRVCGVQGSGGCAGWQAAAAGEGLKADRPAELAAWRVPQCVHASCTEALKWAPGAMR